MEYVTWPAAIVEKLSGTTMSGTNSRRDNQNRISARAEGWRMVADGTR